MNLDCAAPLRVRVAVQKVLEPLEGVRLHDRVAADGISFDVGGDRLQRESRSTMADPARWLHAIHASIPACAASGSVFAICSAALTGARYSSKYLVITIPLDRQTTHASNGLPHGHCEESPTMLTRVRFGSAGAFGPMQPLAMTG